jgi:hypothetical protein
VALSVRRRVDDHAAGAMMELELDAIQWRLEQLDKSSLISLVRALIEHWRESETQHAQVVAQAHYQGS